jgi:hypothetical protein
VFVVRVWWRAIEGGTDTECYYVILRVCLRVIWRDTVTECYCACCEVLVVGNIERNGY